MAPAGSRKGLPGPRMVFFFAPDQIKKRIGEWGAEEFGRRMAGAWQAFCARALDAGSPWMRVETSRGVDSLGATWTALAAGQLDPRVGHVVELDG